MKTHFETYNEHRMIKNGPQDEVRRLNGWTGVQAIADISIGLQASINDLDKKRKEHEAVQEQIFKQISNGLDELVALVGSPGASSNEFSSGNENQNGELCWFSETKSGIRLFGIQVQLPRRERKVLLEFCKNSHRWCCYYDIFEFWENWKSAADSDDPKRRVNTMNTVRSCIGKINQALRDAFDLPKNALPIESRDAERRLDYEILKNFASKRVLRKKPR